jgi:hypothetical protein
MSDSARERATMFFSLILGLSAIVGLRIHSEPLRTWAFVATVISAGGLIGIQLISWLFRRYSSTKLR